MKPAPVSRRVRLVDDEARACCPYMTAIVLRARQIVRVWRRMRVARRALDRDLPTIYDGARAAQALPPGATTLAHP